MHCIEQQRKRRKEKKDKGIKIKETAADREEYGLMQLEKVKTKKYNERSTRITWKRCQTWKEVRKGRKDFLEANGVSMRRWLVAPNKSRKERDEKVEERKKRNKAKTKQTVRGGARREERRRKESKAKRRKKRGGQSS